MFGGDITQSILWGQSSGTALCDAQTFAFPNDPIVKGFIQDSGSALIPVGQALIMEDPTHTNFTFVAKGLGCPSSPMEQLRCVRNVPASRIIDFMANYTNSGIMPPLNFIGTPDEQWIFANYTARYTKKAFSKIMAPFPKDPYTIGVNESIAFKATLAGFQWPAALSFRCPTLAGRKTYRFIYAGNFTDVSPLFWEGAYHATELLQVFRTRGMFRSGVSDYEIEVSNAMQDLWLGFANNADDPEVVGWDAAYVTMLMLGASSRLATKIIIETVDDDPCKHAVL